MHHRSEKLEDGREVYFYTHAVERVKGAFRHVVESAARGRLMEVLGEKFRIILSLFQVVHHLPVVMNILSMALSRFTVVGGVLIVAL